MVYRFYYMALFHSQTRRHMISLDSKLTSFRIRCPSLPFFLQSSYFAASWFWESMFYFKETKSATMNIFRKKIFSKNGVCKRRIKLCLNNKSVHYSWKLHEKVNFDCLVTKTGIFIISFVKIFLSSIADTQSLLLKYRMLIWKFPSNST